MPEARKKARLKSATEGEENSEEIEEDPEEKEWPNEIVRLGESTTLAFWQLSNKLALLCILRSGIYDEQEGMIEYNVALVRKGVLDMLEALGK